MGLPQIPGAKKKGVVLFDVSDGLEKLDEYLINDTVCIDGPAELAIRLAGELNHKYKVASKVVNRDKFERELPAYIEVINSPIQEIVGEGRAEAVKFKNGKVVGVSLVVLIKGDNMSELLVQMGTKGAAAVLELTRQSLNDAIAAGGRDKPVAFPETNYYLPLINVLLNIEVRNLGDCLLALEQAEALNRNEAAKSGLIINSLGGILNKGIATLICEELLAVLAVSKKEHPKAGLGFVPDKILRSLGLQLVDGRISGIAVILGPAKDDDSAVELIRNFQSKGIVSLLAGSASGKTFASQLENKKIELGLDNYIVALGEDYLSAIYAVNFAVRAPLIYGGCKPGQWEAAAGYVRNRVPAFVLLLGYVDEVIVATGLGVLAFGLPIITDLDVPQLPKIDTTLYEALVTEKDYKKIPSKCILARGIKVKLAEVPVPVPYASAFEGERVKKDQLQVEFGGKASLAFEFLSSAKEEQVDDGRFELIGPDIDQLEPDKKSLPLAITVGVFGRKMQKDFEPILERQIHRFMNYACGVMHVGQRDMNWIRISRDAFNKGFRLKHVGVILHAMLHQEYSAIVDKVQVKVYTKQDEVEKLLPAAKKVFDERDERISGMTDESVKDFYSCLLCQSFAPNHVCIVTPERLGLCGAYSWLDAKAAYEITPTGPNQPITKGSVLDERLGQWQSVNEFIYQKSNKSIDKTSMYSLMDSPQSSCVVGNTRVIIDNELKPIGEFIDNNRGGEEYAKSGVFTLKESKATSERIVAMQRFELPEKKDLVTIRTKTGTELILTGDHRIATDRPEGLNWIPACELKTGDRIISLKRLDIKEEVPDLRSLISDDLPLKDKVLMETSVNKAIINKELFYLMGLIASDGSVFKRGNREYGIYFVNTGKELISEYENLYKTIFPEKNLHVGIKKPRKDAFIKGRRIHSKKDCYVCYSNNSIFGILLECFGIIPKKKSRCLKNMVTLPRGYIAGFLTGLFDGDGSIRLRKYDNKWDVAEGYLCCQTQEQGYYLQLLLKRFGIVSNLKKSNSIYKIELHGNNIYEFCKIITPVHREKKKITEKIRLLYKEPKIDKTQVNILPFFVGKRLADLPESKSMLSSSTNFYYKTFRSRPTADNLRKVINNSGSNEANALRVFLDSDFYLDIIDKVKKNTKREKYVYNLTLSDTHCYFANQVLIKNCGCFECIIAIIPEANGVMLVHRDYSGMTPCGMSFTTLAGSVGGGAQTPGFLGIGKLYILSNKFISAEGGLKRVVWMPKELKEILGDKLKKRAEELGLPDLIDKIADETKAQTSEELQSYLAKVKHPALAMEPML
ncbi:MAG: LAGLIDADG family homing endonuclease [Candidatus Omnitrophota bacterium]